MFSADLNAGSLSFLFEVDDENALAKRWEMPCFVCAAFSTILFSAVFAPLTAALWGGFFVSEKP
ncbi:MAG: hypothetical protein H7834_06685 [Magnetococcus sp. YQC-9]